MLFGFGYSSNDLNVGFYAELINVNLRIFYLPARVLDWIIKHSLF